MKRPSMAVVFKAGIVFARFLLLYPFYAITLALTYRPFEPVWLWVFLGVGLAFLLVGFGFCRLVLPLTRKKESQVLFRILQLLFGAALSVTAVIFWPEMTVLFGIFLAPILFAAYEMGVQSGFTNYDQLCSNGLIVLGVSFYVGIFVLSWLIGIYGGPQLGDLSLTPLLLVFVLLYGLVGNQSNLNDLMNRRKHAMSELPTKIRQYNLALMGSISALIILAYLFRKPLGAFFGGIGIAFMNVGILLAQLIMIVIAGPSTGVDTEVSQPSEDLLSPLPIDLGTESKLPLDQISVVIGVIGILLIILLRRKALLEGFLNWWRRLGRLISRFLGKKVKEGERRRGSIVETELYTDEIQEVEGEKRGANDDEMDVRHARRLLRTYEKIGDPVKKVRFGYRAILHGVRQQGVNFTEADTTHEIGRKLAPAPCTSAFDGATDLYEQVRYGGVIPEQSAMDTLAGQMKEILTEDKKRK